MTEEWTAWLLHVGRPHGDAESALALLALAVSGAALGAGVLATVRLFFRRPPSDDAGADRNDPLEPLTLNREPQSSPAARAQRYFAPRTWTGVSVV